MGSEHLTVVGNHRSGASSVGKAFVWWPWCVHGCWFRSPPAVESCTGSTVIGTESSEPEHINGFRTSDSGGEPSFRCFECGQGVHLVALVRAWLLAQISTCGGVLYLERYDWHIILGT